MFLQEAWIPSEQKTWGLIFSSLKFFTDDEKILTLSSEICPRSFACMSKSHIHFHRIFSSYHSWKDYQSYVMFFFLLFCALLTGDVYQGARSPCRPALRRPHVVPQRVLGQIVGVGHHQVPAVEVGGEHERDGADPLHDSVSLWCHLDCSIKTYSDREMRQIRFI